MRRAALLLLLSAACKASTGDVADSTTPTPSALLAVPADATAPGDERLATLDRWNDAMRAHDMGALTAIYDERVSFYGVPMSRVAATSRLDHLFRTTADYGQSVADVTIEVTDASDALRVSFTKRATVQGKTSTVSAYIVLRRVGADYRIVEESDTTTDILQLQPVLQAGEQVTACAYLRPIVEGRLGSFVHAATRMAAFAALTDRRLLLVQTRIGAFKPLLENHGVVPFERAAVKGVAVGQRLVVELADGQLLEFQHEPSLKHVSTQAEFFRQLQQAFPTSAVGASHLAGQRRLQMVGTAVGIVLALLYVWWRFH